MKKIERIEEFDQLLKGHPEHFIAVFKHSTQCSLSAKAEGEFHAFAVEHPDVFCAMIDVLTNRRVSDLVAEKTDIAHASPQVMLFRDEIIVWSATHGKITKEAIAQAVSKD